MVVLVNAGPLFGFWMKGPLWLELETPQTVVTTDRACWGCIPGLPWFPGPAWLPAAPAGPHDSASLQKSKIHPGYFFCDKYHLRDINLKLILIRNLLLQENFPLYMYEFFLTFHWNKAWGFKGPFTPSDYATVTVTLTGGTFDLQRHRVSTLR